MTRLPEKRLREMLTDDVLVTEDVHALIAEVRASRKAERDRRMADAGYTLTEIKARGEAEAALKEARGLLRDVRAGKCGRCFENDRSCGRTGGCVIDRIDGLLARGGGA